MWCLGVALLAGGLVLTTVGTFPPEFFVDRLRTLGFGPFVHRVTPVMLSGLTLRLQVGGLLLGASGAC